MENTNWKTNSLIVLMVIGGLFEVFKHLPIGTRANWGLDGIRFGMDASPYSVKSGLTTKAKLPTATMPRVAALSGVDLKQNLEPVKPAVAPATDAKVAAKTEEFDIYIDPVTGKMMKRKKKKAKKEGEEEKKEEVAAVEPEPQVELPRKEEAPVAQVVNEIATSGGFKAAAPTKKEKVDNTLEEWIALLLNSPDVEATKRFISQYQNAQVSSIVFYKIVHMMLLDSRDDMKQLGVMCAGVTPSVYSFEILAEMHRTQPRDSALRESTDRFIEPYANNLSYLGTLEKVLNGDNAYAAILAAQKLSLLAQRFLTPATPDLTAASDDGSAPIVGASSPNAQYFTRFVTVLENLVQTSTNATVADQAQTTLADLKALLGPSTTQASAN